MIRHRVALTPPIAGRTAAKFYPGYGILGADIPATGDSGGSPVLNDSVSADKEYHWRVVTPPASGTLTIHRDLSFLLEGAADGVWPWTYRLFENNADQGAATVVSQVGVVATQVTAAASQQGNVASAGGILQTHRVAGAASAAGAVASGSSVTQSLDTFVAGSNSLQGNVASAGAIRQTHLVRGAASVVGAVAGAGAVVVSHRIVAAASVVAHRATAGRVSIAGGVVIPAKRVTRPWVVMMRPANRQLSRRV